ncbi:hypothetical protein [Dictyobacter arantiisoli]|uniref:Uncharacterized protein n=1 Tax=Dictyobacter arantiisoli TaxID=2014874 RepID=A0A5A5TJ31_9CHLR|nr:hypothetical protein [Dictyobacter arantiisoli]GCF11228.1 hypothetical protein KDI_47920 [Dictyobacter arantiisoli]
MHTPHTPQQGSPENVVQDQSNHENDGGTISTGFLRLVHQVHLATTMEEALEACHLHLHLAHCFLSIGSSLILPTHPPCPTLLQEEAIGLLQQTTIHACQKHALPSFPGSDLYVIPFGTPAAGMLLCLSPETQPVAQLVLTALADLLFLVYQNMSFRSAPDSKILLWEALLANNTSAFALAPVYGYSLSAKHYVTLLTYQDPPTILDNYVPPPGAVLLRTGEKLLYLLEEDQKTEIQRLQAYLEQGNGLPVFVGISDLCTTETGYQQALEQAQEALDAGLQQGQKISEYATLMLHYFIAGFANSNKSYPYRDAFEQLLHQERPERADTLIETLRLLLTSSNKAEVARHLDITPEGLNRRIDVLKSYFSFSSEHDFYIRSLDLLFAISVLQAKKRKDR